jgi:hypothetical protein
MGFSYNVNVLNQKGSPAIYTDTFANRPSPGYAGRLFVSSDTSAIYEDTGTAWTLIANVSSGAGTLQQVTTNGNTSNVGISITAGGLSTNSLTDTALTLGSVAFAGTGGLISQDNANLFWDDTNNRLGINTNTPGNSLDVHSAGTNPILALNNTAGNQSAISFLNTSTAKWRIGNTATNTFDVYNFSNSLTAISINGANNSAAFNANILIAQSSTINQLAGYNAISGDSAGIYFFLGTSANRAYFVLNSLTGPQNYTLPDATGTLALTSNLSSYLPLSGGTLSGILISTVTSNYFLSAVSATTSEIFARIGNSASFMSIGCESSVGGNIVTNSSAYAAVFSQFYNKPIQFATNNVVVQTITGSGNVLIGSTTDDTVNKLQVTGSIKVTGASNLTGNITIDKTTPAITMEGRNSGNSGTQLKFLGWNTANPNWQISVANFGNGLDLSVSTAAGGSTFTAAIGSFDKTTGIYTAVSDINKKKDFEDSLIGLNAILNLKPTLYRMFNEENTNKHLGFIAQEVKDFIPQAYVESGENENKFIGLNFQAITTTLVKAIQDQQKIIESLIKRIELLENK